MKTLFNDGLSQPAAYVNVGRHRVKQYGNTVYLNNGNEFEIELYNPTTQKVLAKIELNGVSIGSGVVLRPGERVFLERYLNEARKFLFETYEVDGNNSSAQKAIVNNGQVSVKFYNEYINYGYNLTGGCVTWSNTPSWPTWPSNPSVTTCFYNNATPTSSLGGKLKSFGGSRKLSKSANIGGASGASVFSCSANLGDNFAGGQNAMSNDSFLDMAPEFEMNEIVSAAPAAAAPIETGRIEKGSTSNQGFIHDSSTFNSWWSWTSEWKILPISQKPLVREDIVLYCTKCQRKRRKDSDIFCPKCGTKY